MKTPLLRLLLLLFLFSSLAACSKVAPVELNLKGTDIRDAGLGGDFSLNAHDGRLQSLSAFRGKVVALFFGYTHCPDVCPTTMLEYAQAMKALGADAERVQVLFVTLDPERDTPQVLAGYVPHFDKRFLGLSGTPAEVKRVAERYRIVGQKVATEGGGYTIDHSAGSYLIDREGNLRVYEAYGTPAASLAHDMRELLR